MFIPVMLRTASVRPEGVHKIFSSLSPSCLSKDLMMETKKKTTTPVFRKQEGTVEVSVAHSGPRIAKIIQCTDIRGGGTVLAPRPSNLAWAKTTPIKS